MVSKIRELCKERGTSISQLEKQLGFGNGVIGRWDKSVPNYDRLKAVADALDVPISKLTGEEDPAPGDEPKIENPDIRMIARAGVKMTAAQAENLRKYAQYMFPEAFEDD